MIEQAQRFINQPWNARSEQNRHLLLVALITAVAVGVVALIIATGPASTPTPAQEKAWPVSTMRAIAAPIAPTFTGYGRVQARALAKLSSDISARVAAVHTNEGETVNKGDLLVSLDDAQFRLLVAEREASWAQQKANLAAKESELALARGTKQQHASMQRIAQAKLARHRQLMHDRLISQSLFEEAQRSANEVDIDYQRHQQQLQQLPHQVAAARAEVDKAQALLARAELDLAKTALRAPFAGPIISVTAAIGDRMLPGSVLVTMADNDSFELRVPIPAAYVDNVRNTLAAGDQVLSTGSLGATALTRLSSSVAPGQSGVDGFFALTDADKSKPAVGQLVEVEIQLPVLTDVLALPPQAIYDNKHIYAVVEQRLLPVRVERLGETRDQSGRYQVIVSARDLASGDEIITNQLPGATAGLLVKSQQEPAIVVRRRPADTSSPIGTSATPKVVNEAQPAVYDNPVQAQPDNQSANDPKQPHLPNHSSKKSRGKPSMGYPRMV